MISSNGYGFDSLLWMLILTHVHCYFIRFSLLYFIPFGPAFHSYVILKGKRSNRKTEFIQIDCIMPFWTVPNITDSFWKRFGIVMLVKSHTHSIYVMFIWFHRLFESNGPFSQFNAEFIAPKEYDRTHDSILVKKISLFLDYSVIIFL